MAHIHVPSEIPVRFLDRSRTANLLFGGLFAVGLLSFLWALSQDADRAWQSYVSNWLFFTAVAQGAVILAVVTTIVKAKWNWSVRRVSLAFVAYLPIAFVLFLPMLGLRESYFPWIEMMATDPLVQKKAAYLNIPFLTARNVVGLLLLFGLSLYFANLALRPDMGIAKNGGDADAGRARWRDRLTAGWMGQEAEEVRSWQRMSRLAPALVLAYALVMSVVIYDFAMSLEPHWFSTIFGAWYFMGAFWGGIAVTALTTVILKRRSHDFDVRMGEQQLHDLGKLAFAFCVFWTYLFFAQYLVIWYGKLPWEQAWIIHRSVEPWGALSALTIVLCFVLPFMGLIGVKPKKTPAILATFTVVILSGLWLEMHLLVAPSLSPEGPAFPVTHPLIGLMFLGLFGGSVRWFLATFPVIQMWQPPEQPEMFELEHATAGSGHHR